MIITFLPRSKHLLISWLQSPSTLILEPQKIKSDAVSPFSLSAAAAKSLQSFPTLCDPIDGSPPGSPVPGILQARTLEWVAISLAEIEEELKSLLMKLKEESEKTGLKLNIQKMKIMVSGPITSWQIDGETVETVTEFIFLGSKITADGDCSHEIKKDACSLEEKL